MASAVQCREQRKGREETKKAEPNRSLKYGQNFERANEKSTTCAYFFVTEQAISATC
jgi:hypothetical protein